MEEKIGPGFRGSKEILENDDERARRCRLGALSVPFKCGGLLTRPGFMNQLVVLDLMRFLSGIFFFFFNK